MNPWELFFHEFRSVLDEEEVGLITRIPGSEDVRLTEDPIVLEKMGKNFLHHEALRTLDQRFRWDVAIFLVHDTAELVADNRPRFLNVVLKDQSLGLLWNPSPARKRKRRRVQAEAEEEFEEARQLAIGNNEEGGEDDDEVREQGDKAPQEGEDQDAEVSDHYHDGSGSEADIDCDGEGDPLEEAVLGVEEASVPAEPASDPPPADVRSQVRARFLAAAEARRAAAAAAAPAVPAPRRRRLARREQPFSIEVEFGCGWLCYDEREKVFVAICEHDGHVGCRMQRTAQRPAPEPGQRTRNLAGQGQPLGFLAAFLEAPTTDPAEHGSWAYRRQIGLKSAREGARERLRALPQALELFKKEYGYVEGGPPVKEPSRIF